MRLFFAVFAALLLAGCAPQAPQISPAVQPADVMPESRPTVPMGDASPVNDNPSDTKMVDVQISGFRFVPAVITIKAGDTVRWTNKDKVSHTATADDQGFDTGLLAPGQPGEMTFDKPGVYDYHCTPHPGMRAQVVVE